MIDFSSFLASIMKNFTQKREIIGQHREHDWGVSTAQMFDTDNPYETAIKHPSYHDGEIIIVEEYATREQAERGHQKWLAIMRAPMLPATLEDVSTAGIAKFGKQIEAFPKHMVFERKKA